MTAPAPHFLLFSEASWKNDAGQWRFVLKATDGSANLEAADTEPEIRGERLDLLAVVRGLEALDQPSRVTLVTPSRYVNRGLTYGLEEWRANDWRWECFGQMVPVKNGDLWQRVDRALKFHQVECRTRRFDPPHEPGETPNASDGQGTPRRRTQRRLPRNPLRGSLASCSRWAAEWLDSWRLRMAQLGTSLLPCPWFG
ncbi:MAG: RNase H family protein [Pirellulales bacterium]